MNVNPAKIAKIQINRDKSCYFFWGGKKMQKKEVREKGHNIELRTPNSELH